MGLKFTLQRIPDGAFIPAPLTQTGCLTLAWTHLQILGCKQVMLTEASDKIGFVMQGVGDKAPGIKCTLEDTTRVPKPPKPPKPPKEIKPPKPPKPPKEIKPPKPRGRPPASGWVKLKGDIRFAAPSKYALLSAGIGEYKTFGLGKNSQSLMFTVLASIEAANNYKPEPVKIEEIKPSFIRRMAAAGITGQVTDWLAQQPEINDIPVPPGHALYICNMNRGTGGWLAAHMRKYV